MHLVIGLILECFDFLNHLSKLEFFEHVLDFSGVFAGLAGHVVDFTDFTVDSFEIVFDGFNFFVDIPKRNVGLLFEVVELAEFDILGELMPDFVDIFEFFANFVLIVSEIFSGDESV